VDVPFRSLLPLAAVSKSKNTQITRKRTQCVSVVFNEPFPVTLELLSQGTRVRTQRNLVPTL
jgi:hypothetical protein